MKFENLTSKSDNRNFDLQANFVTLLQELRTALDAQGMSLTVAVSPFVEVVDAAYDVPTISGIVDRIHLISYDFHGPWENFAHHHAPLHSHPDDNAANSTLNAVSGRVSFSIRTKSGRVMIFTFFCFNPLLHEFFFSSVFETDS